MQYEYVFEVEFLKGQPLFDVDALAIVTCKLAWVWVSVFLPVWVWPQNKNIENIITIIIAIIITIIITILGVATK